MNREDRDAVRFEHEAIILIENPYGSYYHGKMVNYSQTGMYFESNLPFKAGQTIIFGIENTPYESCPGVYRAIVKWCRRLPEQDSVYYYGIGVEYFRPNRSAARTNVIEPVGRKTGDHAGPPNGVVMQPKRSPAGDRHRAAGVFTNDRRIALKPVADYRKHHRKPVAKIVRFESPNGLDEGVVTDISPGGLFLKVPHGYHVGQILQLAIPLNHKKKEIRLLGEIVHINHEGLGIKFKGLIQEQPGPVSNER